ncbi:protein FAR1-RELATED SEQUENCE 5-like [Aristolochia californica]|uniref:protein FAR1-RELATED SEQUENCE 5-like n=1 Tax=Aristolochia californica TaxID=171875 RepID=UPI0035DDE8C5
MESMTDDCNELTEPQMNVKDDIADDDNGSNDPHTDVKGNTQQGGIENECIELAEPNVVMKHDSGMEVEEEHHIDEEDNSEEPSIGKDLTVFNGDANSEPYVGMEFESQWAARSFYNDYAKRVGFGTRISYSHRSKRDRKMIGQQYVCVKEGFPVNKEGLSKPSSLSARVGCKASMTVKKANQGKWVVKSFEKNHNHELASPVEVQFLRSHRGLSNAAVNLISNIPGLAAHLNNIISGSAVKSDKDKQIVLSQDYNNTDEQNMRGVAQVTLDFFRFMQNENPAFFYAVQVDKEDRVFNAFWADSRSRIAYEHFGDVVVFDTTYLSNKYRIPLASFVGVNHHGQSVLFGCALLSSETKTSFVWVLRSWLAAMSGRQPVSIVTDEDKALKAAVAEVLPQVNHRFCIWHIQRKLLQNLVNVINTHENLVEDFLKCVYQSEEEELEASWASFLDVFELRKNDWLQSLYEDRHYWVPVYLKPTFFAETPLNPKSEPVGSFFDGHVNAETSLEEFFKDYNFVLDSWYDKEVQADFETPILKTTSPDENKAASLYTRGLFEKFQTELFECFEYVPNRVAEDGSMNMYMVTKYGGKTHTVTFDFNEMRGSCNCRMFEFSGILCRHILSVLNGENVSLLPSHYILKRWTRNARSRIMLDEPDVEVQGNSRQAMITRYNDLCHRLIRFAEEGARSVEGYNAAVNALNTTLREVVTVNENVVGPAQTGTSLSESNHLSKINEGNLANSMGNIANFHSPHQSKPKGRATSKLKSGSEKESRRMNTCNTCMKPGHNSRTCPTLTNLEPDIVEDIQMGHLDWGMSIPSIPHARQPYS